MRGNGDTEGFDTMRIWSGLRESNPYPLLGRQVPRLSAKPAWFGSRWAHCPRLAFATASRHTSADFIGHPTTRAITPLLGFLIIAGCAQTPVTVVERVNVPTYMPVPATLTAPVKADLYPGITWGQAVGSLYMGLQTCNSQIQAIATLKPPRL